MLQVKGLRMIVVPLFVDSDSVDNGYLTVVEDDDHSVAGNDSVEPRLRTMNLLVANTQSHRRRRP